MDGSSSDSLLTGTHRSLISNQTHYRAVSKYSNQMEKTGQFCNMKATVTHISTLYICGEEKRACVASKPHHSLIFVSFFVCLFVLGKISEVTGDP